jgi:hypothetical protein
MLRFDKPLPGVVVFTVSLSRGQSSIRRRNVIAGILLVLLLGADLMGRLHYRYPEETRLRKVMCAPIILFFLTRL